MVAEPFSVSECSRSTIQLAQKARLMEAATNIGVGSQGPGAADETSMKLTHVLDLTEAQNLRAAMAGLLGKPPLLLDASAVERMSTPCAQVLLAAGRAADLAGSSFQIVDASEVFRTALADLGLQAEFKKWMA